MHGLERIEKIYAWVCTDEDGTEGVPAVKVGDMAMPMYASRREVAEMMKPTAEMLAQSGKKMALVEFASRITLEEL